MLSSVDRLGKLIKFIVILVVLAVIAVAVVPLNLYYDHVKTYIKPVKLTGISGSALKGSADSLSYVTGNLGQAEWFLYPNSLQGVGGKVRVYQPNYDLSFKLNKLTPDSQSFKAITGYIDWKLIKPFLNMRYGQLDGYAQVNLDQVLYSKNSGVERMSGSISLQDFKLITPNEVDLGTVAVNFETKAQGTVIGNFTSQSNALNVSGSLVLQPNRWQLNLDIIPKAGFYELDAVLNSVGSARRGGGRKLNLAGFL